VTHYIRDMEAHLRNTWQWDAWGFTDGWGSKCTMSDMDGFVPFFAERKSSFLVVEMKHWDGITQRPEINLNSGQMIALRQLSKQPNFTIIIGMGDTSTQTVHYFEVWASGQRYNIEGDFKDYLTHWFKFASGEKS